MPRPLTTTEQVVRWFLLALFLFGVLVTLGGNAVLQVDFMSVSPVGIAVRSAGMAMMATSLVLFLVVIVATRWVETSLLWRMGVPVGEPGESDSLVVRDVSFDDSSMERVTQTCPKLRRLSLARTNITDRSLHLLARLKRIEQLDLSATAVTDKGLDSLEELTTLRKLVLSDTQVSSRGASMLQTMLPNCKIVAGPTTASPLRSLYEVPPIRESSAPNGADSPPSGETP